MVPDHYDMFAPEHVLPIPDWAKDTFRWKNSAADQRPRNPDQSGAWLPLALLLIGLIVGAGIGAVAFPTPRSITTIAQTITSTTASLVQPSDILEVCFSPGGNCASRIVYWIDRANISIHVLIYSFTLNSVGDAIAAAKRRSVDVKIVWDASGQNETGSEYMKLEAAGVDIRVDHRSGLMHNKVAIIDSRILITGSFNWSAGANNQNRENLLVIDSYVRAIQYEQYFQQVWNAAG